MKEIVDKLLPDFKTAYQEVRGMSRDLNNTFGQVRQRINEISKGIADTIPKITALGGSSEEAYTVLKDISEQTKRNIVATSDVAEKIFAINKVLETDTKSLIRNYESIGVQMSRIAPMVEKSISYIQNIGMNAKDIMEDVNDSMSKLNKYRFEGGVEGLAKMAAQASMLKFSMESTFEVAEKALDPEGAIELASAFQRMGVSVGDLTDPFQLMYKSLNDPKGLNESLAQMTKQYTVFNEQTKSFEISPAGIMQMRELSKQTNIAFKDLSESALATANLDRALSQLKPAINFKNEDDKKLLLNIAQMDEMGDYTVKFQGDEKAYKLEELTQDQINKLLEEQKLKKEFKVEELAKQQLDTLTAILGELKSAGEKVSYGTVSADIVTDISETLRKLGMSSAEILNKSVPDTSVFRGGTQETIMSIKDIIKDLAKGDKTSAKERADELASKIEKLKQDGEDKVRQLGLDLEKNFKSVLGAAQTERPSFKTKSTARTTSSTSTTQKVDFGGTVTFKIDAPPGVSKNDLEQYINSTEFKQKIYQYIKDIDIEKEKTSSKTP
jgi:methyl-accepting chemotaxis protein